LIREAILEEEIMVEILEETVAEQEEILVELHQVEELHQVQKLLQLQLILPQTMVIEIIFIFFY
jgi:hypothetical protein